MHVDDDRLPTLEAPHRIDQRILQRIGARDRTDAVESLRPREHAEVGRRLVYALADPTILRRTASHPRDPLLVHFIVVAAVHSALAPIR